MSGTLATLGTYASTALNVARLGGVVFGGGGPVVLGDFVFDSFEVPESITFGGEQALVVHKLPGGTRIIDAMGRDDRDLAWTGTFLGPAASSRAQQLDAMRQAGDPVPLTFGPIYLTVLIRGFEPDYRKAFHIPYRIVCTVLQDETQAGPGDDALSDIQADLQDAVNFIQGPLSVAQQAVSAISPLLPAATLSKLTAATTAASVAQGGLATVQGLIRG